MTPESIGLNYIHYGNSFKRRPPGYSTFPSTRVSLGVSGKAIFCMVFFWTSQPTPSINGPFNSEAALNEGLALKIS
ncbi:hypothetical protein CIHG_10493 [Coccidioides immitis H538.4]|uniref:Uncharacterized protein n=1 Tax=Coccidioides immitis H538.4 TaxID=396776 RepID=A0A0J8S764_COCIT|nr:hypothetical protein CIHG_10493 [Coccidioides immitis H538.4]